MYLLLVKYICNFLSFFVRLWYYNMKCKYIFQRPCIYCLLNIFAISCLSLLNCGITI
ncbi:hypothetical protein GLOIN_2v1670507 [Rhizophagus irregularis DAOM 181602=DAOM 197198]|uniref:Uncharacterized protein n=1 Tax=Rhizophagus irregularis (strain DAOM 181602 / DAOM 197198 / MUCL 43194) TaxID=747089 RepID=A0A2P4PHV1_RHIID|nr:hypothetical protein GLOIN_2v1670507 [Rhizophagus irregularis DAOM 181602=DAOM 197198]POG64969.1 hypothetical protein GLOIN_2v1670507 [Rhizophagus irregularis DAOM 181602=DAOM 197198]|eukprot:XP_025171835.1 hypothetical protein GLOIN_2v1670507 [Rhizophagus irregularis DAOM 181602=DAOM 197198]